MDYIIGTARFTMDPARITWAQARRRLTVSREVDGLARPNKSLVSLLSRGFLLCAPQTEVAMKHGNKLKKVNERREMLRLMQERGKRTPDRQSPEWMQAFWANRRGMLT